MVNDQPSQADQGQLPVKNARETFDPRFTPKEFLMKRMVGRMLFGLGLCLAVALSHAEESQVQADLSEGQVQPVQIAPEADQVLKKAAELVKTSASSFSYTSVGTVNIKSKSTQKDSSTKTEVFAEKPNKVVVKVAQGARSVECYSDGTHVTMFVPSLNAYLVREAPSSLEKVVLEYLSSFGSVVDDARFGFFYMMDDPYQALIRGATAIEYKGVENLEGVDCHKIRFGRKPYPIEAWFQTGDQPFLIKIAPDTAQLEKMLSARMPDIEVDIRVQYSGWKINPPVEPGAFAFVVPEGAEKKESFAEMMRPKDPRDLIGKAAPDFSAAMLDGSQFKLADHKGKNIVIIDFWATWCGPCVYGLPVLNEVANAYKDKGVVFIAVNQGDSPETIKQFQEKKSLVLPVGLDQAASIGSRYYVGGIPQTVLVDKEGKVATVHVGLPVDLKGMLSQELDTLLAGGTLPNEPVQPPKPPQPAEGAPNGGAQESAPPR